MKRLVTVVAIIVLLVMGSGCIGTSPEPPPTEPNITTSEFVSELDTLKNDLGNISEALERS